MSLPVRISWKVPDVNGICLAQADNTESLIINGSYATKDDSMSRYAILPGIQRTLSITATNDLSGVQFEIKGFDARSKPVTALTNGPTAGNTVDTAEEFHIVNSIATDLPFAGNVSVGLGNTGSTNWFSHDPYREFTSIAVKTFVDGNITYSFQATFDDINSVAVPDVFYPIDGVTVPTIPAATPMFNANVSLMAHYTIPTLYSRLVITNSLANSSLLAYFMQQGIK